MFYRKVLFLLASLTVLGACTQTPIETSAPGPLDFGGDPRILRGLWSGANDDHTLFMEVEASDPNEIGYTVTGTFTLDGAEPIAFSGGVRASVAQPSGALSVMTSPEVAPFSAESADGLWRFEGDAPQGQLPEFDVFLYHVDESYSFRMGQAVY